MFCFWKKVLAEVKILSSYQQSSHTDLNTAAHLMTSLHLDVTKHLTLLSRKQKRWLMDVRQHHLLLKEDERKKWILMKWLVTDDTRNNFKTQTDCLEVKGVNWRILPKFGILLTKGDNCNWLIFVCKNNTTSLVVPF